jgi:putative tryptophan/tyrosine transport system substrate-binding protein
MMRRRDFISLLGGAAATWPLAARAQQRAMPVIGIVEAGSLETSRERVTAFLQGLKESGYVDGQNVVIEYRWANAQNEQQAELVADLVRRRVNVIVTLGNPGSLAAKETTTIPTVFYSASDPVELGLVASLNRPGGNLTGATGLGAELAPKRLELLHELIPAAKVIGLLLNPTNATSTEPQSRDLEAAARLLGLQLHILYASAERDFDTVFATLVQQHADGLVIGADAFLSSRGEQLAALTVRHALPAITGSREFAAAGGLMSYGGRSADQYRLVGVYTGRILKGEKPADLPVQQATKVELIINLKTAKALGITVPQLLLGRADEVIE